MNTHTKQQQDKAFETDFIDSQKSDPLFAHLLALSHMLLFMMTLMINKTEEYACFHGFVYNSSKEDLCSAQFC